MRVKTRTRVGARSRVRNGAWRTNVRISVRSKVLSRVKVRLRT